MSESFFIEANYPLPRSATNSMPMHMNLVQCSNEDLTLLDCSYSKETNIDHSKDLRIQCREGKLHILFVVERRQVSISF